jgi:multidrug efflux pump subunit AcrA (membrane-fusion protein)
MHKHLSKPTLPSLAFVVAMASALVTGCGHGKTHAPAEVKTVAAKPVVVTVAPLEMRAVQRRIAVVGNLHGLERVVVSAKVAGRIDKVQVDVGDRVKPGAQLVEINQTDFKLAVEEAQRALERELAKIGLTEIPQTQFNAETLPSMIRGRLNVSRA